jgi:thiosulfate dehydrogenase [quinone] large subunit
LIRFVLCNDGFMPSPNQHARRRAVARERRLPLHAPVRAWALAEWALLPLRLFLGVTFLFAGLQKLANPNFFRAQSPTSIQAQLIASARISPIHLLLSHLIQFAKPLGVIIALSEVAIGLGTLVGLWTRFAAIGGAVLSFTLFLTVSFHASPYFTGADIVFFFAWMPLIVAGGGTRLSMDAMISKWVNKKAGVAPGEVVPIAFATVQSICGKYKNGACTARSNLACDAAVCPVLLGDRAPMTTRVEIDAVDRRTLVVGGAAAAAVGTSALILAGLTSAVGNLVGGAPAPKGGTSQLGSTTSTTIPSGSGGGSTPGASGTLLGPASSVKVGSAATFTIPSSGDPGIVIQPSSKDFVAYDAVCPHAGCTVGYYAANNLLVCPCHGSEFQVANGDVINGPAPHGLTKLKVVEGTDGNLYLQ